MKSSVFIILSGAISASLASPVNSELGNNGDITPTVLAAVAPAIALPPRIEEVDSQATDTDGDDGIAELSERSGPLRITVSSKVPYHTVILNQHNAHRVNHSAPKIVWDNTLASYAAISAKKCVFAHDMSEGKGGYGQNIAVWGSTGPISKLQNPSAANAITNQWYNDEAMNWHWYGKSNPPSGTNLDSFGHFTQVVWKGSKKVGCATVMCKSGTIFSIPSWFTVCNYGPPGNYGNEYGTNVLRPLNKQQWIINMGY